MNNALTTITPFEVTPENQRTIELLCEHYGRVAFLHDNLSEIAFNVAQFLGMLDLETNHGMDIIPEALDEAIKLLTRPSIATQLPDWIRERMGGILMSLRDMLVFINSSEILPELAIIGRIDIDGLGTGELPSIFKDYTAAYLNSLIIRPAPTPDFQTREYSLAKIKELEQELAQLRTSETQSKIKAAA